MLRLLLIIFSLSIFVAAIVWYQYEPGFEPAITAAFALFGFISLFINEVLEERKTKIQLDREEKVCRKLYERIQREKPNFHKLADAKAIIYTGEYHRRAVEEYPWLTLSEELIKLRNISLYPLLTRRLLKHLEYHNPKEVLHLINKLEKKLKRHFVVESIDR